MSPSAIQSNHDLPPSTAAPILAVLAIVLMTLGAYVGGYFWLGREIWVEYSFTSEPEMVREFDSIYVANSYRPAGAVESWLRGKTVQFWVEGEP